MRRIISLADHCLFFLNVLIVFLLVFEGRLVIPSWLQVAGRMHPLFLHFPIVILLLAMALYLYQAFSKTSAFNDFIRGLLLLGSLTASATVIMGLFLAKEDGYSGNVLQWHKWTGVAVNFLSTAFYYYTASNFRLNIIPKVGAAATILCLMIAGHFGAELTHGEDFLLAPVRPVQFANNVTLEEALVYDHIIAPIFEEKCTQCHNASKAKGSLIMTTQEGLSKGGKNGSLWAAGKPAESLMLQRIHLPEEDKKHMPPKNKPQLTEAEVNILHWWIKSGATFDQKVTDLPVGDTLRLLVQQRIEPEASEDVFDFAAADDETINKLNTEYRVIYPLANNSPALAVNIYNAATYTSKLLEELIPVQEQIVSLDLNKMPVTDNDLKIIAKYSNLRKLYLNFTNITGATLHELKALKNLHSISLSGTNIKAEFLEALSAVENLKHLYLWSTSLNEEEIKKVEKALPKVMIETGFKPDITKVLRLTTPKIDDEKKIFTSRIPIKITHPIKGVTIRYTLDGTEPDSINGKIYDNAVFSEAGVTTLKARAYKEGWFGSEASTAIFYKTKYQPDTVMLKTIPDAKYYANGPKTLMDRESGDVNYGSRNGWLGYRDTPFEALLEFKKNVGNFTSITVSTRFDISGMIFPAERIEVWGGTDKNNLKLLGKVQPDQPKDYNHNLLSGFEFKFNSQPLSYIRVVAKPVEKIPAWHYAKDQRAWFFVDEIMFN